jgi:hypothetical protein
MGIYSSFVYGSGVFYGPLSSISYITPSGPTTGGANYVLTGTSLDVDTYNDDFSNPILSAILWTDISSGTGTVTSGSPGLLLNTGATAASYAGVETNSSFSNIQFGIKFYLSSFTSYPGSTVELISFISYVDATNYAKMSVQIGSTAASLDLVCEVYAGGLLVDSYTTEWSLGYSTFNMARYGTNVYFVANGETIFTSRSFVTTTSTFRIYSYNGSSSYSITSLIDYFIEKTFVMFGVLQADLSPIVVSSTRLRGLTPPSIDDKDQLTAFAGTVDIYVINSSTTLYSADAYEYYYVDKFKSLNSSQDSVVLSLVDDDQVVTPTTKNKGI